jgi:hypothetical protein
MFASLFGKQPNTDTPAVMGGFCLFTGVSVGSTCSSHAISAWDSPRLDDAILARDRAVAPAFIVNTRNLEGYNTGSFAGNELAEYNNCTGRSRSQERSVGT